MPRKRRARYRRGSVVGYRGRIARVLRAMRAVRTWVYDLVMGTNVLEGVPEADLVPERRGNFAPYWSTRSF